MHFNIEKNISNFVQNQFPRFYQEEGPDFILFMKAYYEWMESEGRGAPIGEARNLFNYRDIDTTVESFLEYFQKKYLYGIPFNIIANKRFLLKHILDVYRSKGTIQCYKLLFKLLYNEDVDIYLPGNDVLRVSDGTWYQPRYLEINMVNDQVKKYVGKTIIGAASKTIAVAENLVKQNYNNDVVNILCISNVYPKGQDFDIGEKIVLLEDENNTDEINIAPTLVGSLDKIRIVNGGTGYKIGDIIKIVHRDLINNEVVSYGTEGVLRITETSQDIGSLEFDVRSGGFGFTANAVAFVYRNCDNGVGASFDLGPLLSTRQISYNTDLLCDYMGVSLDAAEYGFPANPTGNSETSFESLFSYSNQVFGTIFTLSNIIGGNNYTQPADVFVRSTMLSNPLQGTVEYNTNSSTVTGTNTIFSEIFVANNTISLQADPDNDNTRELIVIREVVSDTEIVLYDAPSRNSIPGISIHRAAPTIIPAHFAPYEPEVFQVDGSIAGENEVIKSVPNIGGDTVSSAVAIESGKGYVNGEEITAYLHGVISNNIVIESGGFGYSNGDAIIFSGVESGSVATGHIITNDNGTIVDTVLDTRGSGYFNVPVLRIETKTGNGGSLSAQIEEFDTFSQVIGRVEKAGIGRSRGFWTTTRGFLNSDKYVQDGYYYQDYSYEIRSAQTLDAYKDVINQTFHVAGTELFGKYLKYLGQSLNVRLVQESSEKHINWTADSDKLTVDSTFVTADSRRARIYILASGTNITADNGLITVDKYYI